MPDTDVCRSQEPRRASLCLTCRFATIVKAALNDQIIDCSRLSEHTRITFPVVSCTAYGDRRHAALHEMEEIAWVLRSDPKRSTIGFVKATELRRLIVSQDWEE